ALLPYSVGDTSIPRTPHHPDPTSPRDYGPVVRSVPRWHYRPAEPESEEEVTIRLPEHPAIKKAANHAAFFTSAIYLSCRLAPRSERRSRTADRCSLFSLTVWLLSFRRCGRLS